MRARHCLSAFLAVSAIASFGPAQARERLYGEPRLAQIIAGRTAGKPVDCVPLMQVRSTEIIDHTAIAYTTGDGTIYVNRPSGANFLDNDDILVSEPFNNQACRLDIVRLIDRASRMPSGSVGLNDFVPYPKPPKAG